MRIARFLVGVVCPARTGESPRKKRETRRGQKRIILSISFLLFFCANSAQTMMITTVAGDGTAIPGYTGDGGPATAAKFNSVGGIAFDKKGNLYVTDISNYAIRKIDASGVVSTFAGGIYGFGGDGGPATAAALSQPYDVCVDAFGSLYISDPGVNRMRRVDTTGVITTVAGGGSSFPDGVPATNAQLSTINGVATDGAGNLYICLIGGTYGPRICKVNTLGIISVVAGNGFPSSGGYGDGGAATAAGFGRPEKIAIDGSGNLFIADYWDYRIRKVNTFGTISTIAGTSVAGFAGDGGAATASQIVPYSVAVDRIGNIYIGDGGNFRVRKIDTMGIISSIAGNGSICTSGACGDGGLALSANMSTFYVGLDTEGNVYIGDLYADRVRKLLPNGNLPPHFSSHSLSYSVCENSAPDSVNTLLAIRDTDIGQTETWSVLTAPLHGAATGGTGVSTGGALTPTGICYTPATGYVGNDSFKITVTDGFAADTTEVHITVAGYTAPIGGTLHACVGAATTLSDIVPGGTWSAATSGAGTVSTGGTVAGISAGTVTISYNVTMSCGTVHITAIVTVNPLPAAISGRDSVCPGATITESEGSLGTWATTSPAITVAGAGVVTGVTTGTGIITFTLPTGCTTTKIITVNTQPAAITGAGSICAGSSLSLTEGGGGVWSASGVAVVGSTSTPTTGIITGLSGGVATISYTLLSNSCYRTAAITVNPTPVISGAGTLCRGSTTTLSGSTGGTWVSGSTGVATVVSSTGLVTGVDTGVAMITFTSAAGCSATTAVTVSPAPMTITGAGTVCSGITDTLGNIIGGGLWSSTYTTVSVGSLNGVVTGVSAGSAVITYSLGSSCTVTKTVTVLASPVAIALGTSTVCSGSTITLTDATIGGTWSITPLTTGTISSGGVVRGITAGTAYVAYSHGGCTVYDTITVNPTPAPIGGTSTVCQGSSLLLTESGGGVWSSSGAATVGSTGIVTGVSAGTAVITYSIGSCAVNKSITVNPISPVTGATGICVGNTTTLSDATTGGRWSGSGTGTIGSSSGIVNGSSAGVVHVTYTTTAGCIANYVVTVNTTPSAIGGILHVCVGNTTNLSNTAGGGVWTVGGSAGSIGSASGVVTGVSAGTVPITYSLGSGCTVSAVVTVNPAAPAITGTMNVCVGRTTTLGAGSGGLWTASGTGTVSSTGGVVTGITAGVAMVSYTSMPGCLSTAAVTVNPLPDAITGAATVCSGLTTTLIDATTGGVWTAGGGTITIEGSTGIVTGVSIGPGTVVYTLPTGCTINTSIYVNDAPPGITGSTVICIGSGTVLSDAASGGAWSSPDGVGVITLGSTGAVTGIGLGVATISYTIGGCAAVTVLTVNSLPTAITGNNHLCVGGTDTLSDAGGGSWSSSNALVATVGSTNGVVAGIIPGTVNVIYSLGVGCTVNKALTVNPTPASITGSSTLCAGSTVTLHDGTTDVVWSSSSGAAAAGSSSGVVTGVSGGTVDISYTSTSTGCASVYPVAVIQVPAIIGSTHICAWGSTMMVSDSLAGGSFTSTLVTVSDSGLVLSYAPGTATITYTESHGCFVVANITVNPLPGDILGSHGICVGASTTLSDTSVGGVWSVASGGAGTISTAGVFDGLTMGVANISYTTGRYGCSQSMTITVDAAPTSAGTITGSSNVCAGSTITLSDATAGGVWSAASATVGSSSGTVSATSAGVATIDYTVSNHCGSIAATKTVTVNADVVPTISISTAHDTVCAGTTASFTSVITNGGSTPGYQWQVNGVTIAGASGSTYSYTPVNGDVVKGTLTSNANCAVPASVVSNSITMTVDPQLIPVVAITAAPTGPILTGATKTFTVIVTNGGTPTYQWMLDGAAIPGATDATYTASNFNDGDSVYCVVMSGGMCGGNVGLSNVVGVVVVDNAGVPFDKLTMTNREVLPNPAHGFMVVTNSKGCEVVICDMLGKVLYRGDMVSDEQRVDISGLANGVYLVRVSNPALKGGVAYITRKLVKAQ